jgi:immune inhibitor A
MRRLHQSLVLGAAMATIACASLPATAQASPAARDSGAAAQQRPDNRPGPKTEKWLARKAAAQKLVAAGKAKPNAEGVVELADGTFAEVTTTKTDKIFTILSEFGTQAVNKYGTAPGPLHNEIPEPDRSVDNSTTWEPDYDTAYYEGLFNGAGESMKGYYESLSNGQYSVVNTVSDWVQVPYNASYYGDNAIEDFGGSWQFIEDTGNAWYDAQIAAGLTPAQIDNYLAQFDVWDRYDFDNDGDFDEAAGYIDHFQAVHAGQG